MLLELKKMNKVADQLTQSIFLFRPSYPPTKAPWGFSVLETTPSSSVSVPAMFEPAVNRDGVRFKLRCVWCWLCRFLLLE